MAYDLRRLRGHHPSGCTCVACQEGRRGARGRGQGRSQRQQPPRQPSSPQPSRQPPFQPPSMPRAPSGTGQGRSSRAALWWLVLLLVAVGASVGAACVAGSGSSGPDGEKDSVAAAAPPAAPSGTSVFSALVSTPAASAREEAEARVQEQSLDCAGADVIKEIRDEYAANPLRARETYIGKRVCLRGKISSFHENERYGEVNVAVTDGVSFPLRHTNRDTVRGSGEELNSWNAWRVWVLASSAGDTVEAECEIVDLAPAKNEDRKAPGIPILDVCQRVVDGVLWTIPTATPVPTPTPPPCSAVGYSYGEWLNIDCPAGRVTIGTTMSRSIMQKFPFLTDGDSNVVAFYFPRANEDPPNDPYRHHSSWKRWVEDPESEEYLSFVWTAPPDVAAIIIAEWRRGVAEQLVMRVEVDLDVNFYLTQPPGPLREWQATASKPAPVPTLTPTPAPTATPTLTPAPTAHVVGVTGVGVWSRPAAGNTYQIGETIVVTVTFGEAVDVSGSPHLAIDMDPAEWGRKEVAYAGGSGTATLVFAHEVVEPNVSTLGIAVLENSLELGGGTIRSVATGTDAALAHEGLDHDPVHKVDWRRSQ